MDFFASSSAPQPTTQDSKPAQLAAKKSDSRVDMETLLADCSSSSEDPLPVSQRPQRPLSPPPMSSLPMRPSPHKPPPQRTSPLSSAPRSSNASSAHSKRFQVGELKGVMDSDDSGDESEPGPEVIRVLLAQAKADKARKMAPPTKSRAAINKKNSLPKKRMTMGDLLKSANADKEAEAKLQRLTKELEGQTPVKVSESASLELAKKVLGASGEQDEDLEAVARRKTEAMARLETAEKAVVWHFFDEKIPDLPSPSFPKFALPAANWSKPLRSTLPREAAFKNGFVKRIAKSHPLPTEILQWMLDDLCSEEDGELMHSYLDTFGAASSTSMLGVLKPETIRSLFTKLGAKTSSTDTVPITAEYEAPETPERDISFRVRFIVDLLKRLAMAMPLNTIEVTINILIRLSIDDTIIRNPQIQVAPAISALISALPESSQDVLNRISYSLFDMVKNDLLRQRIISALPITPARAHHFRRQLALAFSLDKSTILGASLANRALFGHCVLLIQQRFALKPTTNYAALTAQLKTLDVAIDAGFDVPPPRRGSPVSAQLIQEHREFNQAVDTLAETVQLFHTSIPGGASHMTRMHAHQAAERLEKRLRNAVRTEPAPSKVWIRAEVADRGALDRFVTVQNRRVQEEEQMVGGAEERMDVDG
ncbi:hypothetical protein BT63DRAFT_455289 [Microthyrium microscopicum]|uniref:Uncharacterized protein n=1 Tax=Microthyrium microscopicum TaxID=703497 RepID=A0A6A6UAV8_9PEZI|nr:hypothetical protein BT63DRAFT_455289 [Microthyrium microscopicum]